jgi:dTDP-4-dehydrorhamnose reductase
MKILITGAGGLVGSALAHSLRESHEVVAARRLDLDITDDDAVAGTVDSVRPDLIINCAVTGVDECERDRDRAIAINVSGPRNLARAASARDARIIHLSTNYVFDGTREDEGFYEPDEPALPINFYGVTKRKGEQAVVDDCRRSVIVRTSWVFGAAKPTLLSTMPSRLRSRGRVTTIDDLFASCTYVDDLVTRIVEIVESDIDGIVHANNSGVCSQTTFAQQVAAILDMSSETAALIERTTLDESPRLAPRPRWTPMRCSRSNAFGFRPMRSWQEALADYCSASR